MATQPAFLRGTEAPAAASRAFAVRQEAPRVERDRFELRALPHEDVFFFCKKIDNSRLVREADPRAGGACWTVIGGACLVLAFLTGILAPNVANTVAGYKLEALRVEAQTLADERRTLELQEAQRLSPERLDKLAQGQNLVTPTAGQVVHLENKGDKVAMLKQ
jgi:hypothetical protein